MSKSFKQIHMDWTYEKYLRNQELEEIDNIYSSEYMPILSLASLLDSTSGSFNDPVRSVDQMFCSSVAGFTQHPNSSKQM
jgi:hypothetical protein